jgi:hypothetical protein
MADPQNITYEPKQQATRRVEGAGGDGSYGLQAYAPISCQLDETDQDAIVNAATEFRLSVSSLEQLGPPLVGRNP